MPSLFSHDAIGSLLDFELPPHWNHNKHSGIVLCVIASFKNCQGHANLTVKFTGEGSCTSITWKVGSLIEQDNEVEAVESDHVFIGYTKCLDFMNLVEGQDPRKCSPTKASLEFSVTSGNGGEVGFEVLKSGFGFLIDPEEKEVPLPRNHHEEVKGKTKINGAPSANGCLKDRVNGYESPNGMCRATSQVKYQVSQIA